MAFSFISAGRQVRSGLNNVKSGQLRSGKLEDEKIKSEQLKSETLGSDKPKSEKLKSEQLRSEKLKSEQLKSRPKVSKVPQRFTTPSNAFQKFPNVFELPFISCVTIPFQLSFLS